MTLADVDTHGLHVHNHGRIEATLELIPSGIRASGRRRAKRVGGGGPGGLRAARGVGARARDDSMIGFEARRGADECARRRSEGGGMDG